MEVRWSCLSCLLKGMFFTAVASLSLISSEQVGSEPVRTGQNRSAQRSLKRSYKSIWITFIHLATGIMCATAKQLTRKNPTCDFTKYEIYSLSHKVKVPFFPHIIWFSASSRCPERKTRNHNVWFLFYFQRWLTFQLYMLLNWVVWRMWV